MYNEFYIRGIHLRFRSFVDAFGSLYELNRRVSMRHFLLAERQFISVQSARPLRKGNHMSNLSSVRSLAIRVNMSNDR
jgi:hypothetical protein